MHPTSSSSGVTLDHVGIAVYDIHSAATPYRALLGLELRQVEEIVEEGVRVGTLSLTTGGAIELLEPTRRDSPIARFLEKRGPGIHHLSFRVPDCRAAVRAAEAAGIRPLAPAPRPGAGGTLVAFFDPQDTGGVLIEVVELPARPAGAEERTPHDG